MFTWANLHHNQSMDQLVADIEEHALAGMKIADKGSGYNYMVELVDKVIHTLAFVAPFEDVHFAYKQI